MLHRMSSSLNASPEPIQIPCPQPPIADTSPLYPLVLQALERGVALREHNGHLWRFGRALGVLRTLRAYCRLDGPYLLRSLEEELAARKAHGRVMMDHLDQEVLDRGVHRLLEQPGMIWDFGAAMRTLHGQQSCDRPAFTAAIEMLESEWPRNYIDFAMALAGNLARDQAAGHDLDVGALAVLMQAPRFITPEILSSLQRREAECLWREQHAGEQWSKREWFAAHGMSDMAESLDWDLRIQVDWPICPYRLWAWARIPSVFSLGQVTRPGIDEGKLCSLMYCPAAVRRALWPLAPTLGHQGLASVAVEMKDQWQRRMTCARKRVARQLARRTTETALKYDVVSLGPPDGLSSPALQ